METVTWAGYLVTPSIEEKPAFLKLLVDVTMFKHTSIVLFFYSLISYTSFCQTNFIQKEANSELARAL